MRWEVYQTRNVPWIASDPGGRDFVFDLIRRMHFPSETGDKRKRKALRKMALQKVSAVTRLEL